MRHVLLWVIFLYSCYCTVADEGYQPELIMLSVVFKHGNQSAINYTFPNDPYKNVKLDLPPNTLTEIGEAISEELGARLNYEYREFIEECKPNDVDIYTSRIKKCRRTLEKVLSTLLPRIKLSELKIQSENPENDTLLATHISCKKHIMDRANYVIYHESQLKEFEALIDCMGFKIENYIDVYYLFTYIKSLDEQNYELPECMIEDTPHFFYWYSGVFWSNLIESQGANAVGNLIYKIAEESTHAVKGNSKKLQIYSGHDINFVGLVGILQNYYGNYENYCSYIAFEVYKSTRGNFVKVVMDFNEAWGRRVIQIPNCPDECPLEDFIKFAKSFYLGDAWCK